MATRVLPFPKKKKIHSRALQKAIAAYVEETSFTISVPTAADKPYEITFRTFVDPSVLDIIVERAAEIATVASVKKGVYTDYPVLETVLHTSILEFLSDMPLPSCIEEDDTEMTDTILIGGYGAYFYKISKEYRGLFEELKSAAERRINAKLECYKTSAAAALESMDFTKVIDQLAQAAFNGTDFGDFEEE